MGNRTYIYVLIVVFFTFSENGLAKTKEYNISKDTIPRITVLFDLNKSCIDKNYAGNKNKIALLDTLFTDSLRTVNLDSITVLAYTSPDGNSESNKLLSAKRSESITNYLQQHSFNLDPSKIIAYNKGEDWNGFLHMVTNDAQLPNREEVIALMEYHSNDKRRLNSLLKFLNGGEPYQYIKNRILLELRRAEITVYGFKSLPQIEETQAITTSYAGKDTVSSSTLPQLAEEENREAFIEAQEPESDRVLIAIKNNLLYDLALAPNIEIEIPLGRRWSVNAEYKSPWWSNSEKELCYQMLSGGVEGRYWMGNRRERSQLTGHFLGVYAEGGNYDFQFKGDGYRGKYYMASGLTYGYAKRLSKHLSIEFSLGVGYLTTEYRRYTPYEGSLVGVKYGQLNWIGPTKAKISLAWLIIGRR